MVGNGSVQSVELFVGRLVLTQTIHRQLSEFALGLALLPAAVALTLIMLDDLVDITASDMCKESA